MQNPALSMTVLQLKDQIVEKFTSSNWQDIALVTNSYELINGHGRLLQSLRFGDDDYESNVTEVLLDLAGKGRGNLETVSNYVDGKFGKESAYNSENASSNRITFGPSVFALPNVEIRDNLVAVMMPFAGFDAVHTAIRNACSDAGLDCRRADDIWDESTFIQDIVNLIFEARIVICDFSKRNPNVFYETGIAHTLGKEVVPISQNMSDIPSDLTHHRVLEYLGNKEGLQELRTKLAERLRTIARRT